MTFQTATTTFARPLRQPVTMTRGGGAIMRARQGEFLDLDQIAQHVPSVFADAKHESRSERYVYADTREVLGGLIGEGFGIVEARQGGSRIEGKAEFTKHMLRLRHRSEKAMVEPRLGDVAFNEVVLINSHDGTSSYQLAAGMFRLVCLNGMVAGELFEEHRIGHTRRALREEVIEAAFRVVEQFPRLADMTHRMAALDLSPREQLAFATAARELRWDSRQPVPANVIEGEVVGTTAIKQPPVEAAQLLQTRRAMDNGADLWRTLNRVQENVIKGGQHYTTRTTTGRRQRRQVGAVNGIDQDRSINRALFTLAEEMMKLKAA